MKCGEIIRQLNILAPESYAQEWDNPGLLCGSPEQEVNKVLLALDATDEVVEQAAAEGVQLLITHHPLIFQPIKRITDQGFIGRRLIKLIQGNISYYAMHTNYDAAPHCMADLAAARIGLKDTAPLQVTGELDGCPYGIGKIGSLTEPMSAVQAAELIKQQFGLPFVSVYGTGQVNHLVSRVAVCPGSGRSMIRYALAGGAELLITGDIGHHEGIDAAACHMAVIDAGHYGLEHIFMGHIGQYLRTSFGAALELAEAKEAFPVKVF